MVKDFIVKSKYYLIALFVLGLVFWISKSYFIDIVYMIDGGVIDLISYHIVSDSITPFFKFITYAGSVGFLIIGLIFILIFIKNKKIFLSSSLTLLFTYIVSVIFKNIFRRERPLVNLIEKPKDYSFPSGHTMCSIAFYGFLVYLVLKYVKNKYLRWFLISLLVLLIVLVAFSRMYLNVHYFTDVLCGAILGLICLSMCVNYVRINNIV